MRGVLKFCNNHQIEYMTDGQGLILEHEKKAIMLGFLRSYQM